MDNHTDDNFVFGSDEGDTFADSLQSARIDKLNQKITLLSILIPLILAVVFAFLYLDLRNKVMTVQDSGASEVRKTAEDLKKDMEALTAAGVAFEKRLAGKIADLEKTMAPLQEKIKKIEKDVSWLGTVKSDKKSLDSEIKTLTEAQDDLKKGLANLGTQNAKLVTIAQELQNRTKGIPSLETAQASLKADVDQLKSAMVDKEELAADLKKQKVFYQLEIQALSTRIDKKIQALESSIPAGKPQAAP
ncbi:hypothetical protein JCM14469_31150 [Desulfatiferula olefinivorans]